MLQKKNWLRASSEDGLRIDSQGVVYRQDADGLVVQEVDDYSPLKKRSGWSVDRYLIEAGIVRIEAKAFLNETDETDANGIPPHSIALVVDGGGDEEIAAGNRDVWEHNGGCYG